MGQRAKMAMDVQNGSRRYTPRSTSSQNKMTSQ